MINTKLPPVSHRFRDIALDRSKSLYLATPLAFNSPDGGFPCDDFRKIFRGRQQMAKVPTKWRRNITENFNELSWVHERYRRQTGGRRTGNSYVC